MSHSALYDPASPEYWGTIYNGERDVTNEYVPKLTGLAKGMVQNKAQTNGNGHHSQVLNGASGTEELRNFLTNGSPQMVMNDGNLFGMAWRWGWNRLLENPRARDLYYECGYPDWITAWMYREMYDREGPAARVVNLPADECWQMPPIIYDDVDMDVSTPFKDSLQFLDNEKCLNSYMHRIDRMSGIGSFGLLFYGIDDGLPLSIPVPGLDPETGLPDGSNTKHKIMFFKVFDETEVQIAAWPMDPTSPRYGHPEMYFIRFVDYRSVPIGQTVVGIVTHMVHWTRVTNIADNRMSSETFGVSRQQNVWNRLLDLRKVYGGSGEMFWKAGFPGLSIETQPDVTNPEVDFDEIEQQVRNYHNNTDRTLMSAGLTVKQLQSQMADPNPTLEAHLKGICLAKGYPWKVFVGSEQGKNDADSDMRRWHSQCRQRQGSYLNPYLVRPVTNKLIYLGAIDPPKDGKYFIKWPDLDAPTENDRADTGFKVTQALSTYVSGQVYIIMPLFEYLTVVWHFPTDLARKIVEKSNIGDLEKMMEQGTMMLPGAPPPPKPGETKAPKPSN